eukprot:SAG11_NODE_942_length_6435_cov_27.522096_3_plen_107_part_00
MYRKRSDGRRSGQKIITIFEKESHRPGIFDYSKAVEKYKGTEWEFILGIDSIPYQREQFAEKAMLENILAKANRMPRQLSLPPARSALGDLGVIVGSVGLLACTRW